MRYPTRPRELAGTLVLLGLTALTGCATGPGSDRASGPVLEGPAATAATSTTTDPGAALQAQPPLPDSPGGDQAYLASSSCGVERWSIKTGTDAGARRVDLARPHRSTIATLAAYPAPASYPNSRLGPVETTAYQLTATLVRYKLEHDSDLHLVLEDAAGQSLIVEIPDPACMGSSPWRAAVARARRTFTGRYAARSSFRYTSKHVVVTGVGFYDRPHGQSGAAPNGVELHAVTDLAF